MCQLCYCCQGKVIDSRQVFHLKYHSRAVSSRNVFFIIDRNSFILNKAFIVMVKKKQTGRLLNGVKNTCYKKKKSFGSTHKTRGRKNLCISTWENRKRKKGSMYERNGLKNTGRRQMCFYVCVCVPVFLCEGMEEGWLRGLRRWLCAKVNRSLYGSLVYLCSVCARVFMYIVQP